ncbi:MAG: cytochrome c-type biogenesis protein CcmH [Betaproteobacteria bacterium]|nr:cytochrome c-type biogenesis protein CcmH [Betaproteobacteria bacterium]MDH5343356.1 cytochrome c-type biogenesis protein CcmH [Betaproteobacteria bacterium]
MLLATAIPAWASEAQPTAADVVLEKRVMTLAEELRCLVCQNQTIADSHAPLAVDLRNQVREKLSAGMSEREIIDYMVARYGDFVLYRPPIKATTMLLWFGPPLLLLLGLWLFARTIFRRRAIAAPLSPDEQARARALLDTRESHRP